MSEKKTNDVGLQIVFVAGGKGPGQYTSKDKITTKPGERVIIAGKREVQVRQPVIRDGGLAPRAPGTRGKDRVPPNKKG